MTKMTDSVLVNIADSAVHDSTAMSSTFQNINANLQCRYNGDPYGDELPNRSAVISNDVQDVVESDMPSMARIFLGPGQIHKFQPNRISSEEDRKEAEDKTHYVDWQIRKQPWSFSLLHGWIKNTLIQKTGVVKYFYEETTEVETHSKHGLSLNEIQIFMDSFEGEDIKSVEVDGELKSVGNNEQGEETFDIEFKVEKTRSGVQIRNIPLEQSIITRNAESKDAAQVVGDWEIVTRGELIARGFKKSLVMLLENAPALANPSSTLEQIRAMDQGGVVSSSEHNDWSLEEVLIEDLYLKVDYDGDGISERRHVIKSGDIILENEVFNHVPYAYMSSIDMPHNVIGKSRAEITAPTARIKTALQRRLLDNIYAAANPDRLVSQAVNIDDLAVKRFGSIIRMKNDNIPAQGHIVELVTPYTGDKTQQVLQYFDQQRAQTTGSLQANQGLDTADIGKETATRFAGVDKALKAKVELVARVMAETGFRDLYEGVAWVDANFQDSENEIEVLGKELKVNPGDWKLKHSVVSNVGLGIGDSEETLATMSGYLQIMQQLKATGSPLVDDSKIYNALDEINKASGRNDASMFFNNPERPEQLIQAENEQLKQMIQQLQAQVQASANPLAEAETIKARQNLIEAQGKIDLELAKLDEQKRKTNIEAELKRREQDIKIREIAVDANVDLTKIEAETGKDTSDTI